MFAGCALPSTCCLGKGKQFCANGKSISRLKLEASIIGGLQQEVLHPEAVERFVRRFRSRVC